MGERYGAPITRTHLEEWNRLSFYGGSSAADLFSTSPATSSALAYLEKEAFLASADGSREGTAGAGSTNIQFTEEDLDRIRALRGKNTPRRSAAHQQDSPDSLPTQTTTTTTPRPPPSQPSRPESAEQRSVSEIPDSFDAEFDAVGDDAPEQLLGGQAQLEDADEEQGDGMGRAWASQSKHFFILSDAGKPIYSRHGDEQKLCSLMGVMQGIFSFVSSGGDDLQSIYAGQHVMVFLARGPLYLVAIASSGEPAPVLKQQLEWLHLQIISTITSGITKIFETRPCFDLRSLLRGSTKFIDNLVEGMDRHPSYLLYATQCLPLEPTMRSVVGTYLQGVKSEDLVYALLIADGKLVNFVQPKRHPLHSQDLQLILNFLASSGTFRTNETWVPICLPKFNDGGYLYAYLCYLNEDTCLVLISTVRNSEKFYELAEWKQKIDKSLRAAGALDAIAKSVSRESYRTSAVGIPGLVSFLYRHNTLHQFTGPSLDPPYHTPPEQARILRRYQKLHATVIERTACGAEAEGGKPPLADRPFALRQYWDANDRESNLVWLTSDVLLMVLFEPWVARPQAVHAANDILKWVKSQENTLFVLPAATQTW